MSRCRMFDTPKTINEIFMNAVEQFDSPRAFSHKRGGRWVHVSHAEALRRVRAIALGLRAIGVRKAEPILLLAEKLSTDIAYLFLAARLPILQGYGLTETSPVISVNPSNANRIGTVGKPVPGVQVRIAEDGEILARGPGIMRGYFHRGAETQASFADGWFKTGDLGRLDDEGYLIVTDRKKDLIKTSGGKFVAPLQVEGLILASRFISQAVVIGNSRRFPAALIVPNAEMIRSYAALKGISAPDYSDLVRHPQIINLIERQVAKYTAELPQYGRIKRIALIDQEFSSEGGELTLTQKLRRRAVEKKYQSIIDAMYEEEGMQIREPGR